MCSQSNAHSGSDVHTCACDNPYPDGDAYPAAGQTRCPVAPVHQPNQYAGRLGTA